MSRHFPSGEVVSTPASVPDVTVQRVVTHGQFTLDGGTWDVDNNVWLVGDSDMVVVIDAAHDAGAILDAVGERQVAAIICTHGHNDHVNAATELRERTGAIVLAHPDDRMLWDQTVPGAADADLADKQVIDLSGTPLTVLHTPGHTPGACCVYAAELGVVFSGDTLFQGGPGATGRSFSSRPLIERSIRERLFTLPRDTVVLTGHGDSTTIAAELERASTWEAEG